ncbi:MAG TPA: SDR family oxidoreductase [Pseudonocardiaceae bacterium]|nr:SDR family oxidoreductase [Pseudonocardiaceae bacterium]
MTGGGRGLGRAIAQQLAAAGARVAVLARSADELDRTVATIETGGGSALAVRADVADPEQINRALAAIRDRWGPVEVLVNNAGVVSPLGSTVTVDPDGWAAAVAINLTAPALLTVTLLPSMIETGWGRIVNVSSGIAASPGGMPRANAYVTTKAAVEAHTLNLAAELEGTGVTVNVYRPGGVDTAMQSFIRSQDPARIGTALHDRFVRNYEANALLSPDESAASLLARLAGDSTGRIWDAADPVP